MIFASSGGAAAGVTGLILFLIVVGAYFIPLAVAVIRKVPNVGSVAVVNVLLGWTFIGWAVALAMACRSLPPVQQINVYDRPPQ